MSPRNVESLAQSFVRDLSKVKRQVRKLENKNDLGYSSIEDSRAIDEYGTDGTLLASFGGQYDGSNMATSFTGPTPPEPTAPICTGGITAIIRWDGYFAANLMTVAPLDFSRVEIHASQDPNFEASMATSLRDTFESPRGGEKTISLPPGVWYIRFVARSIPGKPSPQSAATAVTVEPPLMSAEWEAAKAEFDADMLALTEAQRDLDAGLELAEGRIFASEQQLAGAVDLPDLFARKVAAQSGQYIELDVKQLNVTDSALIKTGVAESFFAKYFTTNRLSANQVYVGPGANAVADPFFEDEVIKTNRQGMSTLPGLWSRDATLNLNRYGGTFADGTERLFYYNAMPDSLLNKAAFIPVFPGDRWKVRAKVNTVGGGARILMRFITKDGLTGQTPTGMKTTTYSAPGTVDLENEYTVSSSVAYIMPCIQFQSTVTEAYVYGGAELRSMLDASLFVEGAINGQIVTGAVFQTHPGITEGLKFVGNGTPHGLFSQDNNAMVAYGTNGIKSVHIDGKNNLLTGQLATNPPGQPGFIFVPSTTTGKPGMWLSSDGSTSGTEAAIFADEGWNMVLRGKSDEFGFRGAIQLDGGFQVLSGGVGHKNTSWSIGDTGTGFFNQLRVTDDVVSKYFRTAYPGAAGLVLLNTDAGQPGIWFSSNGSLTADQPAIFAGSDYRLYFRGKAAGAVNLTVTTGMRIANDLEYWDPPTSTFGANLGIASTPKDRIYKLTSNPKFKLNIQPQTLEKAKKLLQVIPIDWYDKFQAEAYAAYLAGDPAVSLDDIPQLRRIPGLNAQNVLDVGLEEYVTYNTDGELEGIYYDRLWVLLILLVQHLWTQVETMQDDIGQLKEKVRILWWYQTLTGDPLQTKRLG